MFGTEIPFEASPPLTENTYRYVEGEHLIRATIYFMNEMISPP